MLPSVKQLRYICAVAEYKHFSKAAEACHVTQSTLSAAIQELESQLGVVIFERNKKTVLITPLGEKLLHQARLILGNVEISSRPAKSHDEVVDRGNPLGRIPTIGPFMLPQLLAELRHHYSKLKLFLKEDLSANLLQQLQEGKLDLAILAFPYPMPDMETLALFRDDFLLCLPPGHQLERRKTGQAATLTGRKPSAARGRSLSARPCARGMQTAEFSNRSGLSGDQSAYARSDGREWLGRDVAARHFHRSRCLGDTDLQVREFGPENVSRKIGMAWRKSDPRREEYLLLSEFIKANTSGSIPIS